MQPLHASSVPQLGRASDAISVRQLGHFDLGNKQQKIKEASKRWQNHNPCGFLFEHSAIACSRAHLLSFAGYYKNNTNTKKNDQNDNSNHDKKKGIQK